MQEVALGPNPYGISPNEMNNWIITITPLAYGYTVQVGCKTVAITDKELLKSKLVEYLDNPKETREKFLAGTLFT